jgi:glycosyltransferase involved in cell wall biosynthesis
MIVKNEDAILSRCLNSVYPFIDEIVIYDTGSIDNTKEIALLYDKVRYIDGIWENSFAIARNKSIENAIYDWILWIDADEFFDPSNASCFKQLTEYGDTNNIDAYDFLCQSFVDGKHWALFVNDLKPKLFRNYCRFVGGLHENLGGYKNKQWANIVYQHHKKKTWQLLDDQRYEELANIKINRDGNNE